MHKLVSLLILGLAAVGAAAKNFNMLEKICMGHLVEFESVSELEFVIHPAKHYEGKICTKGAIKSILDLEKILKAPNVCSIEVAKMIGNYYNTYVSNKGALYRELPKSIKKFFKATGSMISKLCKDALLRRLEAASRERITMEDERTVLGFESGAKCLAEAITGKGLQIQSLFMVTDTGNLFPGGKNFKPPAGKDSEQKPVTFENFHVNVETMRRFGLIRNKCINKFRPVYSQLISPLVILSNLGFDYNQGSLGASFKIFSESQLYKTWMEATFICEVMLDQKVSAVSSLPKEGDKQDSRSIKVLDNQMGQLRASADVTLEQLEPAEGYQAYQVNIALDPGADLKDKWIRKDADSFRSKRKRAKKLRKKQQKIFLATSKRIIKAYVARDQQRQQGAGTDPLRSIRVSTADKNKQSTVSQTLEPRSAIGQVKGGFALITILFFASGIAGFLPGYVIGFYIGIITLIIYAIDG